MRQLSFSTFVLVQSLSTVFASSFFHPHLINSQTVLQHRGLVDELGIRDVLTDTNLEGLEGGAYRRDFQKLYKRAPHELRPRKPEKKTHCKRGNFYVKCCGVDCIGDPPVNEHTQQQHPHGQQQLQTQGTDFFPPIKVGWIPHSAPTTTATSVDDSTKEKEESPKQEHEQKQSGTGKGGQQASTSNQQASTSKQQASTSRQRASTSRQRASTSRHPHQHRRHLQPFSEFAELWSRDADSHLDARSIESEAYKRKIGDPYAMSITHNKRGQFFSKCFGGDCVKPSKWRYPGRRSSPPRPMSMPARPSSQQPPRVLSMPVSHASQHDFALPACEAGSVRMDATSIGTFSSEADGKQPLPDPNEIRPSSRQQRQSQQEKQQQQQHTRRDAVPNTQAIREAR